jgi:uncharacterized repeat protein (TIGR01451 family)
MTAALTDRLCDWSLSLPCLQTAALFPDVSITSTPGNVSVPVGSITNITLFVSNIGTGPATNVTLVELLPPGLQIDQPWVPPSGEQQQ